MEDGPQLLPPPPPPPPVEPISRPSSTSTQESAPQTSAPPSLPQLPGISSLTPAPPATSSPQLRATHIPPPAPSGSSPASAAGPGGNLPTCQNCSTSTTPLWRRDEMGAVLCNACGLFLKLHGRPRPISLKTDVIKSRNRVKTMRPDLVKQKKQNQSLPATADANGGDAPSSNTAAASAPGSGARKPSARSANGSGGGGQDDNHSPISRTATPSMYNSHGMPLYPGMEDAQFQPQSLPGFPVAGGSPGRATSPLNGDRFDTPPTQESLMAANASLKTRVSELEFIQELYRGRLQQLETDEASARQAQEVSGKTEAQLRSQLESTGQSESQLRNELEESHRRENMLKRRLDELELELKETKESLESHENGRAKKPRLDDSVQDLKPEPEGESAAAESP